MEKHQVPDNLVLVKGILSNLQWSQGSEDFVFTKTDKNVAGSAAIGAAALGQAFNAGGLAMASGDTGYTMNYFVGKLGDITVKGRFYQPDFKDGDEMEMVGTRNGDVYEVVAARRLSDRLLWILPSSQRGHKAHRKWAIKWSLILAFVIAPLTPAGIIFIVRGGASDFNLNFFLAMLGSGFLFGLMTLAISYEMYTKATGSSYITTGILQAFGYKNPEWVDLAVASKLAVKQKHKETGKYFSPDAFSYWY